jgi:hypothetical protein
MQSQHCMESRGSLPGLQVHTIPSYLFKIILLLYTHLLLSLPSGFFPSSFPVYRYSSPPAIGPAYFILLDLIFIIIFGVKPTVQIKYK